MATLPGDDALGLPRAAAVVVGCSSRHSRRAALAVARSLQLPFHDSPPRAALLLLQTETRLELHDAVNRAGLWVEYSDAELRRYRAGSGPDLLRRAVGRAGDVVDATAGLGRDAVHLAMLGYRTTAIERSLVVGALVRDGLERARRRGILPRDNPAWRTGDACALLPAIDPPAAVYLDPMFPPKRKKSAAVRKEVRFLRLLAADAEDPAALLAVARACATDRVVVKRPLDAPPLAPGVSASYRGKLVRYDVYRRTP